MTQDKTAHRWSETCITCFLTFHVNIISWKQNQYKVPTHDANTVALFIIVPFLSSSIRFCQSCLQECLRPQKPVCAVCRATLGQWTRAADLEALIQSSVAACKGCGAQVWPLQKLSQGMKPCIFRSCKNNSNLVQTNEWIQWTETGECFYFETGAGNVANIYVFDIQQINIDAVVKDHFHCFAVNRARYKETIGETPTLEVQQGSHGCSNLINGKWSVFI